MQSNWAPTSAASPSGMEFQQRDMEWPVFGSSTESRQREGEEAEERDREEIMQDIEDGGDQIAMMHSTNEAIPILDENIGSSVDCYDTSSCGIGSSFVRIADEDFSSDSWTSNGTVKRDFHPVSDAGDFEAEQKKIHAETSSSEYDAPDRYQGTHSYNSSAGLTNSSPAQARLPIETAVVAVVSIREKDSRSEFTGKYASSSSSSSQGEVL